MNSNTEIELNNNDTEIINNDLNPSDNTIADTISNDSLETNEETINNIEEPIETINDSPSLETEVVSDVVEDNNTIEDIEPNNTNEVIETIDETENNVSSNQDVETIDEDQETLNQEVETENETEDIITTQEETIEPLMEENVVDELTPSETITNNSNETQVENTETTKEDKVKESLEIISDYGENFSTKEYLTNPAIGRDEEIKQLIVTLLTPEKSAILVGKPGIGKTAIVEGLGYRIRNNDVPNALKGYTIFKLNTASLTGIMPGTNELRIQYIVDHLKNLDKIMVFIDEIHTLIGNGDNTLDFANIFKPIIDRGTIKIIGATTSDEYDRYVLRDKAFVRRFQRIDVSEPTRDMVIQIMMGTYPKFEKKMGLKLKYSDFIKENIMAFITDATSEFKRVYETSVRYPDIALTILQQAFSYAAFDNREEVTIRDVRKAIQTTKLIYPDVIKKELVRFNTVFKDVYLMETKQILKDET